MDPLILTLGFDDEGQARFDAARQRHFPPERNMIPAHLTLFHALPGEERVRIERDLGDLAARVAPFRYRARGILDFGRGAAYDVDVPGLRAVRAMLRDLWWADLTEQDRQGLKPHVTVQNKADRETAAASLAALRAGFSPWEGRAPALKLWHYRGGPWEAARTFELKGPTT